MKGQLKTENPDQGKALVWVFAALYLLMLILNGMTPMSGDDFAHYYGLDGEHIRSLSQIGEQLMHLWQNVNGRLLAHFFVYLMQIPLRWVFRLVNALTAPALLWLMLRFAPASERRRPRWLLLGAMLLWSSMPGFGEVFLWLTGSCNYGWSLPLLLAALLPFFRAASGTREEPGLGGTLLWWLLCFVTGAYNETCAIALLTAAALLSLIVWIAERRFPVLAALALIWGLGGFALLLLAPATLGTRTGELSLPAVNLGLKNVLALLTKLILPMLLYVPLFAWAREEKAEPRFLAASTALLLGGLVSALILAVGAYQARRCFSAMGCLSTLSCLILAASLPEERNRKRLSVLLAALSLVFALFFFRGTRDIFSLFLQGREREAAVRAARERGQQELTLRPFVTETDYSEISYEELEASPEAWYNELLAKYYGLERVRGRLSDGETGEGG